MPSDPPETILFHDAPAAVLQRLTSALQSVSVVAITGPTGSGKSTLAARIAEALAAQDTPSLVISTDRYLPDYSKLAAAEVDRPEHSDLPRLARNLTELKQGRATTVPTWSFHTHAPSGAETLAPAPVIILEGIFALHDTLLPATDLRLFVQASENVRWDRVERRELSGDRGWGVERSLEHFHNVAKPSFEVHEPSYRANAHQIVKND